MVKKIVLLIGMMLLSSGCLDFESVTYNVVIEEESANVEMTYEGLYSGETEAINIKEDFDELIGYIQDDTGAEQDAIEKGMTLESKKLYLEDDKIKGKLIYKVPLDSKGHECMYSIISINKEEVVVTIGKESSMRINSNGKIYRTKENYIIKWPAEKRRRLVWSIYDLLTESAYKNNLVELFKKWKKKNQK